MSDSNIKVADLLDLTYFSALHPMTNGQYERFVRQTRHLSPDRSCLERFGENLSKHWKDGRLLPELALHQVGEISWSDVQAYCRWAELSLPGEMQ